MPLLEKHLFVKESTIPGAGMGLFTHVAIAKGSRIIQYTGRVSTWEKADHQEGLNAYIYYMNDDNVIDASKRKNSLGRYANDARGMKKIKGLLNNCDYVEEGVKVFIEATKDIAAGGEILVSYGKEYWDVLKKNYSDLKKETAEAEAQAKAEEQAKAKNAIKPATSAKTGVKKVKVKTAAKNSSTAKKKKASAK